MTAFETTTPFKPPMIDGVSASCVYLADKVSAKTGQPWPTLLDFLIEHFAEIDASEWLYRIENKKVFSESGEVISLASPYQPFKKVFYYRELKQEITIPFQEQILVETDHLLVVDKPHFLPVSPTGQYVKQSLLVRLKQQTGIEDLTPIHRLDRETAGVMLFCKQSQSRALYQTLFQQKQVQKTYHAIASYRPDLVLPCRHQSRMEKGEPFFTMHEVAGEPNSLTDIDLIKTKADLALYALKPLTGKQHQLRVHLASLGIPILNDDFYPVVQPQKAADDFSKPLQLLAHCIEFKDPISDQLVRYQTRQSLTF